MLSFRASRQLLQLLCIFFLYVFALCLIVSASSADPIVQTDCGPVAGSFNPTSQIYSYRGIPYAQPPVGTFRWQPPQSYENCWTTPRNATNYGNTCVQFLSLGPSSNSNDKALPPIPPAESEDCLFINIFTPIGPQFSGAPLPVIFYIHGGSLMLLSGSDAGNNGELLASSLASVVVTINYRLGPLGFLALQELTDHAAPFSPSTQNSSANLGFMDQIFALRWTVRNIAAFGGDPNSITIAGQSSGGTSVLVMLISPFAKGLFQRAILMSSSFAMNWTISEAYSQNRIFVNSAGCNKTSDIYSCLMALSVEQIKKATPYNIPPYWGNTFGFDLPTPNLIEGGIIAIDNNIIPIDFPTALKTKTGSDVPVIFSTMAQEIDLLPVVDIEKTVKTDPQYNEYIQSRFALFDSTGKLANNLLNLYNFTVGWPYQQRYETLASDIGDTCGNSYFATLAASSFNSPIYRSIISATPSKPVSIIPLIWKSKYSFHCFDLYSSFNTLSSLGHGYDQNSIDLGTELIYYWKLFMENGKLPEQQWPQWQQNNPTLVVFENDKTLKIVPDSQWRADQCKAIFDAGLYQYGWNN